MLGCLLNQFLEYWNSISNTISSAFTTTKIKRIQEGLKDMKKDKILDLRPRWSLNDIFLLASAGVRYYGHERRYWSAVMKISYTINLVPVLQYSLYLQVLRECDSVQLNQTICCVSLKHIVSEPFLSLIWNQFNNTKLSTRFNVTINRSLHKLTVSDYVRYVEGLIPTFRSNYTVPSSGYYLTRTLTQDSKI